MGTDYTSTRRRVARAVLALAIVSIQTIGFAPPAGAAATITTLHAPSAGTKVQVPPQMTPDGTRVVFASDRDTAGVYELYVVPIDGGTVTKLSAPMAPDGDIDYFSISPDGTRVAYTADQDTNGTIELYSVAITGGPVTKLSPALVGGGNVGVFEFTPTSSRVVYFSDVAVDEAFDLYSSPIAGGAAVRLNLNLPVDGDVTDFRFTPDGSRVVMMGDTFNNDVDEATTNLVDGSDHRFLHNFLAEGDVTQIAVTPDSTAAVYIADHDSNDVFEVYTSDFATATETKLSPTPVLDGDVVGLTVAPDGSRVVFRGDMDTDEMFELYSMPLAGGAATKLNPTLIALGDVDPFPTVSPDSSRVVFRADVAIDGEANLWSAPIGGGSSTQLNQPIVAGSLGGYRITPNAARVVYRAEVVAGRTDLFSVPIAGGVVALLSPGMIAAGDVDRWAISPDSNRVVFSADAAVDQAFGIHWVPVTGGARTPLNSPAVGDRPFEVGFSPDGNRFVFSDQPTGDGFQRGIYSLRFALPVAVADVVHTTGPIAINVLANDSIAAGTLDPASVTVTSAPFAGTTSVAGGVVTYTPLAGFLGTVGFTYRVCASDDPSLCATANVSVTVLTPSISAFSPLTPFRVFDSRPNEPAPGPKGALGNGGSVDVQVTGLGGVPADASAVVLNVTSTGATGAGFVTVWPAGQARPLASNLNLTGAGQTRPNLVVVPIGAGGRVSMFAQSGGHLIADVTGYFRTVTGAVSPGRILPLPPTRIFDTRPEESAPGPKGLLAPGGQVDVQVTGVGGIPADAAAVVLNVTATQAQTAGFVTVWPAGQTRPNASTLNLNRAGDTTPNLVIMPVGVGGRISMFSQAGGHLLADVTGWVTGPGATASTSGLFVPVPPGRVFDTRAGEVAPGPKGFVAAAASITTRVGGQAQIDSNAALAFLNITATQAATGFVTSWPTGQLRPTASTLNLNGPDDTRANAALLPLGSDGRIDHFVQAGAHLIADTTGYTLP